MTKRGCVTGGMLVAVSNVNRCFERNLLLALVEAGALTKQQAASVATQTAEDLRGIDTKSRDCLGLMALYARHMEDHASKVLTGHILPRDKPI